MRSAAANEKLWNRPVVPSLSSAAGHEKKVKERIVLREIHLRTTGHYNE